MNNSTFKRKAYVRTPVSVPRPIRAVALTVFADVVASPKVDVVRSEPYRRLVAALACKVCGIAGYSQAAHPSTGKGAGIKTSDLDCFALCCDRPGIQGCHPKFDQGALFSKLVRQALEPAWVADTRRQIIAAGVWPKGLPVYESNQAFAQ